MAKRFDHETMSKLIIRVVEDVFKQMCHVAFSTDPVVVERDIIEYDGKMRIFPMEKFNGPAYITLVNYHVSQKDLEARNAVGTFILFVKEEAIEKLMRARGRRAAEADEEPVVFDVVGELASVMAGNLKNELRTLGCMDLILSAPVNYKNAVAEGVPFDYSLYKKQEVSFSFWNQKSVVVEVCVGAVPA